VNPIGHALSALVRFTPNSDCESGLRQTVMSALPPKADHAVHKAMSALGQSGHRQLLDHLVGTRHKLPGYGQPERFGGF